MIQEKLLSLINSQYISEKGTNLQAKHNQYIFNVAKKATKPLLKQAIEELFKVKVDTVRIVNVPSKVRRFKQIPGTKKGWKKAYVSLAAGHTIDLSTAQG